MKNKALSILILTYSLPAFSQVKENKALEWTNFTSNHGYAFKHPSCWMVKIDNPDEKGPLQYIKDIFVEESSSCARPKFSSEIPNGVGFGFYARKDSEELKGKSDIDQLEKWATSGKNPLASRRIKLGNDEAIFYVETLSSGELRWNMMLFCSTYKIKVIGPTMQNPSSGLLEKIKGSNLEIPEPENTIYQSVKCISPKETPKKSTNKIKK